MKKKILCVVWLFCLLKEIYEFIICEKNAYSCFLLLTLLASVALFVGYWFWKERDKTDRKLLYIGMGIFAVREVIVTVKLTLLFMEMLPYYTNPFLAAVKLYVGVLIGLTIGCVTWLQKDI